MNFIEKLIKNYSEYFLKTYNQEKYPNQDYNSCEFLYEICLNIKPDSIIDIGTNFGASTLSLAYGLKNIGKSLEKLTTIDYSHDHWRKTTPIIQKELLEQYGLDISLIKAICNDFRLIKATDIIEQNLKYLIFYDIHDMKDFSFVNKFFDEWIPLLKGSTIIFHDVSLVSKSYTLTGNDLNYPRSVAQDFNGRLFAGFKECSEIMAWVNRHKINITPVERTSIVWFNL